MAQGVKGVVFDFGNVLYSVDYPALARRLAGDRAEAFLRRFVGSPLQIAYETGRLGLDGVLSGLAGEGYPVEREAFLDAFVSVFEPIPGVRALLERLAARVPLGLLSNTSPEHARLFIERVPEFPFFTARTYSFEVGEMKPAPSLYLDAAARLRLAPAELVFVDDLEDNVEGARAVGFAGIRFTGAEALARSLAALGLDLREGGVA